MVATLEDYVKKLGKEIDVAKSRFRLATYHAYDPVHLTAHGRRHRRAEMAAALLRAHAHERHPDRPRQGPGRQGLDGRLDARPHVSSRHRQGQGQDAAPRLLRRARRRGPRLARGAARDELPLRGRSVGAEPIVARAARQEPRRHRAAAVHRRRRRLLAHARAQGHLRQERQLLGEVAAGQGEQRALGSEPHQGILHDRQRGDHAAKGPLCPPVQRPRRRRARAQLANDGRQARARLLDARQPRQRVGRAGQGRSPVVYLLYAADGLDKAWEPTFAPSTPGEPSLASRVVIRRSSSRR